MKISGPRLVPILSDNKTYGDSTLGFRTKPKNYENLRELESVANQFRGSWRHPTTCPEVQAVYKIVTSKTVLDKYNAYR